MVYCTHALPRIYDVETGEAYYELGNVWVCPVCKIQWHVVPNDIIPDVPLNMWRQPNVNTIRPPRKETI